MLWTILVVLLILALVGVPGGPIAHGYGWGPSGVVGVVVVVLLVLLLAGRL